MSETAAIKQRISIRSFLPTMVPEALVRELLDAARWSPSGGNLQPWKVIAVAGADREAVSALARGGQFVSGKASEEGDDPVYPPQLWEPYRSRRYQVGEEMYALLGVRREDRTGRLAHVARNFDFFGALPAWDICQQNMPSVAQPADRKIENVKLNAHPF